MWKVCVLNKAPMSAADQHKDWKQWETDNLALTTTKSTSQLKFRQAGHVWDYFIWRSDFLPVGHPEVTSL